MLAHKKEHHLCVHMCISMHGFQVLIVVKEVSYGEIAELHSSHILHQNMCDWLSPDCTAVHQWKSALSGIFPAFSMLHCFETLFVDFIHSS